MSGHKDRVYVYKSQAMREYGITAGQIADARDLGLIYTKIVRNPFDKNRTSLLIDVDTLCNYLEKVRDRKPAKRSSKVEVVASRNCLICGVEIKSKRTLVGHLPEYCDEHNPRKRTSK